MWDLEGDEFEIFEGPGILKVANLPLDKPKLKAVVFVDGDWYAHKPSLALFSRPFCSKLRNE